MPPALWKGGGRALHLSMKTSTITTLSYLQWVNSCERLDSPDQWHFLPRGKLLYKNLVHFFWKNSKKIPKNSNSRTPFEAVFYPSFSSCLYQQNCIAPERIRRLFVCEYHFDIIPWYNEYTLFFLSIVELWLRLYWCLINSELVLSYISHLTLPLILWLYVFFFGRYYIPYR